jgi:hypothetical protein
VRTVQLIRAQDRHLAMADWSALWREAIPRSNRERAAELLQPVAALRQAVIYRLFLDHIEPAEQIYHSADPAIWLRRAASGSTSCRRRRAALSFAFRTQHAWPLVGTCRHG